MFGMDLSLYWQSSYERYIFFFTVVNGISGMRFNEIYQFGVNSRNVMEYFKFKILSSINGFFSVFLIEFLHIVGTSLCIKVGQAWNEIIMK